MIESVIELLKVIFLGIVEGITEWLPISSTGHMLLVDEFLQMNITPEFKDMFLVVIQLGAILAVVILFWEKMWPFQKKTPTQPAVRWDTIQMWLKVVVACIPGAVVTLLFDDYIEAHLHTPAVIAAALIIYGIGFILIENWNKTRTPKVNTLEEITYRTAFLIGLFQVLSIIPGTSRSGVHHHRGPAHRGVPGGGGGVYLLPGGAGDVRAELREAAAVRLHLHQRGDLDPGGGVPGGLPGLGGGHQVPHGLCEEARLQSLWLVPHRPGRGGAALLYPAVRKHRRQCSRLPPVCCCSTFFSPNPWAGHRMDRSQRKLW